MRNPRRLALSAAQLHSAGLKTSPPGPGALFWELWSSPGAQAAALQALQSPYIQGIASGTLDPDIYGGFTVNDAYYCFNGAADYQIAAQNEHNPQVQTFLQSKYNSYENYNQTFPSVWHVSSAASVTPNSVTVEYSDFESSVLSNPNLDPVYLLIAMLPCDFLWAWLANQLATAPVPNNVYSNWINGNNDFNGAYAIGNFLEDCPISIDYDTALGLYVQAMTYEAMNFLAADPTGLPALMPGIVVPPAASGLHERPGPRL